MKRSTAINRPTKTQRLDYLDAVRGFALLLGIVFHASLSFIPVFIGWAVMDVSTSDWVSAFALISHAFRMEVFFLIAGFFSAMTLERKGLGAFIASRAVRIGIPFVLGWCLLRPLIVGGWVLGGQSLVGDVDVMAALEAGYESLAALPRDLLVGTHLWFLYYLLLITALLLFFRGLIQAVPAIDSWVEARFEALAKWMAGSRLALPALAVPTAVMLWFMNGWGMDTPDRSLVPDLPVLAVYTLCFSLGWLLHRQPLHLEQMARLTPSRGWLCVITMIGCVALAPYQGEAGHAWYSSLRALFVLFYAVMMWSLVMLCIGLFKRFLDRPSPTVRYLADASYWLYLVHLPIVVWLQVAVAELPLNWAVKLTGISVVTVMASLLAYDLVVRSTWVGKLLNGKRKERALPGLLGGLGGVNTKRRSVVSKGP